MSSWLHLPPSAVVCRLWTYRCHLVDTLIQRDSWCCSTRAFSSGTAGPSWSYSPPDPDIVCSSLSSSAPPEHCCHDPVAPLVCAGKYSFMRSSVALYIFSWLGRPVNFSTAHVWWDINGTVTGKECVYICNVTVIKLFLLLFCFEGVLTFATCNLGEHPRTLSLEVKMYRSFTVFVAIGSFCANFNSLSTVFACCYTAASTRMLVFLRSVVMISDVRSRWNTPAFNLVSSLLKSHSSPHVHYTLHWSFQKTGRQWETG